MMSSVSMAIAERRQASRTMRAIGGFFLVPVSNSSG